MSRIVLSSPAKLNLFLKVLNKRPDGYHNIVTVFERIDLSDEMDFRSTRSNKIRIVCGHPDVPRGPKNLVYKMARLLQQELGIDQGAEIRIKKRIPVAAGLAGGSSNAATALLGLNSVWKLNLSKAKMLNYAKKIGSDVSFFLHDTSYAVGSRRGEYIKKLNINKNLWHVLVVPRMRMYTWKVYQDLKCSRFMTKKCPSKSAKRAIQRVRGGQTNMLTKVNDNVNILIHNLKKDNVLEVGRLLANDLETVVFRLSPRLKKLKKRLKSLNTKGVMISGSGPSVFGLTMTKREAEAIKAVLSRRFAQVFVVKTL